MATLQDLYTVARRLTVEMRGGLVGVHASRATHEYVDIVLLVGVALKPSSRIGFDPVSDHCPPSLPPVHLVLFCAGKTRGCRGTRDDSSQHQSIARHAHQASRAFESDPTD